MAYTVVSVFPVTADAEEIKRQLKENGIDEANIVVSKSNVDSGATAEDYREDEQTKGFFEYTFAHDTEMLDAYRRHSVGKSNIVVYADTMEQAAAANSVLNRNGALEVYRKPSEKTDIPDGMTEEEYNGIIAKAKNNLYFLGSERVYHSNVVKGMDDSMDDLGSKD